METHIEAIHFTLHVILYILIRGFRKKIWLSRTLPFYLALDISILYSKGKIL
jgi:hypothetical protein